MSKLVILENVADERGESSAKVARTLVRLGCDLYLRFGPSREPHTGEHFFPDHLYSKMKHNINPGDYPLTKDSQEAVIKRLGRVDFETKGLFVLIYTKVDSSITVPYQIELKGKNDESICVVVDPDDVAKLPPLSKYQTAPVSMYPAPPEKNNFKISEKNYHKKSNPELHNIFWRAFIHLRDNDKFSVEPQYKQVWETVYNELRAEDRLRDNKKIPSKRKLDPHDHIEVIDPVNVPDPKLQWIISGSDSRISNQGTYSLSSLPPLLSKLKKNPPKI